jgi:hypothetical protein
MGRVMVMVGGCSPNLKNVLLFFGFFFAILNLPSVFCVKYFLTFGKIFVECPKKVLSKELFANKIFDECSLQV